MQGYPALYKSGWEWLEVRQNWQWNAGAPQDRKRGVLGKGER